MIMDHTLKKPYESRVTKKDIFFISLSFFILILFYFLPTPDGLTHDAQMMIGIMIMAAVLWITEPIPLAVTGLLIMILQPLLGIISADNSPITIMVVPTHEERKIAEDTYDLIKKIKKF